MSTQSTSEEVEDILAGLRYAVNAYKRYKEDCVSSQAVKYQLSRNGRSFEIKAYHPGIYKKIRKMFGVRTKEFTDSWTPNDNEQSRKMLKKQTSTGKGGAHFIFSKNRKYILKTLFKYEKKHLEYILHDYYQYLENNRESLLVRFFGCYRLSRNIRGFKYRIYFVVMNNVLASPHLTINEIYDLKGSKHNRKTRDPKKLQNPGYIRLDLDLNRQFVVGDNIKKKLMKQIKSDAKFLAKHNIMDYSLLVGVHFTKQKPKKKKKKERKVQQTTQAENAKTESEAVKVENSEKNKNESFELEPQKEHLVLTESETQPKQEEQKTTSTISGLWSEDKTEFYQMGIIDILQPYNSTKKFANFFKSLRWKYVRLFF